MVKKILYLLLMVFTIYTTISGIKFDHQDKNLYNDFKQTKIISSAADISNLKDRYVLLRGKVNSSPETFDDEYISPTNSFVYLEERKRTYVGGKYAWQTNNTSYFYAKNVSVLDVPLNLKDFFIYNSENISADDFRDAYKKNYHYDGIYFNKPDGKEDTSVVYDVLRNNDDILVFAKIDHGKLLPLSDTGGAVIFAGENNYNRLNDYLKDSSHTSHLGSIMVSVLMWFITIVLGLPFVIPKQK